MAGDSFVSEYLFWPKIPSVPPVSHDEHESEYDRSLVVGTLTGRVTIHGAFSVI